MSDSAVIEIPAGIDIRRVVVRNMRVTFLGADGRECFEVTRGVRYPGEGLGLEIGEHVAYEEP